VPVSEADSVVGRWRHEYDPVAAAGVPAHVTLVVPWVAPDDIDGAVLAALEDTLSGVEPFDFELTRVGWFARRVLWVAPEPSEPFIALTHRLADRFGTPPWEGAFDEVVPHLTVAHASDGVELQSVAADLETRLPVSCRAGEVWAMVGGLGRWERRHRVVLGA
jgi:2'-5' RNA ligase